MHFLILLTLIMLPIMVKGQSFGFGLTLGGLDGQGQLSSSLGFCIPFLSGWVTPEDCVRCQCSFLFQWACRRTCQTVPTTTTTTELPVTRRTTRRIPIIVITPPGEFIVIPPSAEYDYDEDDGTLVKPPVAINKGIPRRKNHGIVGW